MLCATGVRGSPYGRGYHWLQTSNLTFGRHFLHDFVPGKDGSFCHDDNTRSLGPTAHALGCRYHRVTPEKEIEVLRLARTAPSHQPSKETLDATVEPTYVCAFVHDRCACMSARARTHVCIFLRLRVIDRKRPTFLEQRILFPRGLGRSRVVCHP